MDVATVVTDNFDAATVTAGLMAAFAASIAIILGVIAIRHVRAALKAS